ncbi:MAG: hypothetical protein IK048_00580 [Clostridia bacterium]|nr:hypothetical protein [Clostridia bacterium]
MNFWERNGDGYNEYDNQNANRTVNERDWRERIGEYAGRSQDELMQELLSTASRMKGEGTLTARDLDDFYSRVSVFLNDEQRARMRALIETLKR